MMHRALIIVFAFSACSYSDPGTGTHSLLVQGALACQFATMQTDVTFSVSGTPAALANANITLLDADTHETLHVAPSGTPGRYAGVWPGFHRRVEVQVWAESEGLSAHMEGPGKHTLVRPHTGAMLRAKEDLQVAWATADGVRAETVTLGLGQNNIQRALARDSGTARFTPKDLGVGRDTVTVTRSHTLELAGGQEGSSLSHSYSVAVDFINAP